MMHVDDIEIALDEDDIPSIQGAFRALIDFPHEDEIEGAESVQTLIRMLDRVVDALGSDRNIMPAATCAVLHRVLSVPVELGSTYADGARVVVKFRDHWRALYLAHATPAPGSLDPQPKA